MKRKILLLAGRLRRFFNAWAAVAIAHHAHQAASAAQQQRDLQQLDSIRFYRGPIDQLFARWGLPQSQRPEQLQKSIARQQPTKIQGG